MPPEPPSFDLVVATVGRIEELGRLFDSLDAQSHRDFRAIVVDQSGDDQVDPVLAGRDFEVLHLRSAPGLSRARNVGLEHVRRDAVAFPDDDCTYPADLLALVAGRFAASELDGLTGRVADAEGRSSGSWKADGAVLDRDNLWNRANSAALFLRRALVERVGVFDEQLGLGSETPWHSGEEIDYLLRAIDAGARIEYDPSLVVGHALVPDDARVGYRDGASVGYLLRKHRYPVSTVAQMAIRPVGGAVVALAHRDRARARFYAATLRGRMVGYRKARRANSSA